MTKSTKIVAALGVVAGLGIAALPLGTFAAEASKNVEVELTVDSAINIASGSADDCKASMLPGQTATCTAKIGYATNNATGMTLTLKDANEDTNLVHADDSTATIATGAGAVAEGTEKWNVSGGLLSSPTAMVASNATALTVASENGPVDKSATNDMITMTYHFSTANSTKSGVYSDIVTYTAATK